MFVVKFSAEVVTMLLSETVSFEIPKIVLVLVG